jgi:hypothetical protein
MFNAAKVQNNYDIHIGFSLLFRIFSLSLQAKQQKTAYETTNRPYLPLTDLPSHHNGTD